LFRSNIDLTKLAALFKNPREHTGDGYHTRAELEARTRPSPTSASSSSGDRGLLLKDDYPEHRGMFIGDDENQKKARERSPRRKKDGDKEDRVDKVQEDKGGTHTAHSRSTLDRDEGTAARAWLAELKSRRVRQEAVLQAIDDEIEGVEAVLQAQKEKKEEERLKKEEEEKKKQQDEKKRIEELAKIAREKRCKARGSRLYFSGFPQALFVEARNAWHEDVKDAAFSGGSFIYLHDDDSLVFSKGTGLPEDELGKIVDWLHLVALGSAGQTVILGEEGDTTWNCPASLLNVIRSAYFCSVAFGSSKESWVAVKCNGEYVHNQAPPGLLADLASNGQPKLAEVRLGPKGEWFYRTHGPDEKRNWGGCGWRCSSKAKELNAKSIYFAENGAFVIRYTPASESAASGDQK